MTNTTAPRIERATKKLYVPHGESEIAFVWPAQGQDNFRESNTYMDIGQKILEEGLKLPTGDYTASLLHFAYCNPQFFNEPEFEDFSFLNRHSWLWVFNQNLWTNKGVYVIQDLQGRGTKEEFDSEKIKRLEKLVNEKGLKEVNGVRFSRDETVRFAPAGTYRLGNHTPKSLSRDGFVIASYNLEGAKKLREVSAKIGKNIETSGIDVLEIETPELTDSAICENYGGLFLIGDGLFPGLAYWGQAFGVL